MYEQSIREEFTHQSDSFARSPVPNMAETLGTLVELVPADPARAGSRWPAAPAIVARALAPRVGSVHGVDLTPAMVEKAGAEAAAAAIANAEFSLGDATALISTTPASTAPSPASASTTSRRPPRVLAEMARVVRPGGLVVVADHLTDPDGDAAAWHEEIERLRDPSHWACLTPRAAARAG